jgi:DNA-binding protein Fis
MTANNPKPANLLAEPGSAYLNPLDPWTVLIEQQIKKIAANQNQPGAKRIDLYRLLMQELERPLIEHALEKCRGNKIKAAEYLGINRNTLHKKIKVLAIKSGKQRKEQNV